MQVENRVQNKDVNASINTMGNQLLQCKNFLHGKKKFPTRKQTHFILIWLLIMILPESDMFQAQKSSAKIFTFYTCPCPLKVKSSIKIQTVVNSIQWEWQTTGVIKVGFIFLKELFKIFFNVKKFKGALMKSTLKWRQNQNCLDVSF